MINSRKNQEKISLMIIFAILTIGTLMSVNSLVIDENGITTSSDISTPKSSQDLIGENWNYEETLEINIEKSGDAIFRYDLLDHGVGRINFPIDDLDENANDTYSQINDVIITLDITEIQPLDLSNGPIRQNSFPSLGQGYFSHVSINFRFYFPNPNDNSLEVMDKISSMVANLSIYLTTEFYVYNNYSTIIGDDYLDITYIGIPQDFPDIWSKILDDSLTLDSLTSIDVKKFKSSPFKQYHLVANWDEYPNLNGQTNLENLDERWEFDCTLNYLLKKAVVIKENVEKEIPISSLIQFSKDNILNIPLSVNESDLYIYPFIGASVTEVSPYDHDEDNYYGNIHWDLVNVHNRQLTDDPVTNSYGSFSVIDDKSDQPCVKILQIVNTSQADTGEGIEVTYNITNVGTGTAYNIDVNSDVDTDMAGEFTLVSGEIEPTITELTAGTTESLTYVINAVSGNSAFVGEAYVQYDAINDPDQDITWKRPTNGYRYLTMGNNIFVKRNSGSSGASPVDLASLYMDVTYETSVEIGDEITFLGTIYNPDVFTAHNILWRFENQITNYNLTNVYGIIDNITAGSNKTFSFTIKIDSADRLFGEYTDADIHISWDNEPETNSVNDEFEVNINIHPKLKQKFGPVIAITPIYSASSLSVGGIVTVTINVQNIGDMIADSVNVVWNYGDGPFEYYAGQNGNYNFGPLGAGEEFTFVTKAKLLRSFEKIESIQFVIYGQYFGGKDLPIQSQIYFISYSNLHSKPFELGATGYLGIFLGLFIGVVIVESIFIYKKERF